VATLVLATVMNLVPGPGADGLQGYCQRVSAAVDPDAVTAAEKFGERGSKSPDFRAENQLPGSQDTVNRLADVGAQLTVLIRIIEQGKRWSWRRYKPG